MFAASESEVMADAPDQEPPADNQKPAATELPQATDPPGEGTDSEASQEDPRTAGRFYLDLPI